MTSTPSLFTVAGLSLAAKFHLTTHAHNGNPHGVRWELLTCSHFQHTTVTMQEIDAENITIQASATLPNSFIEVKGIAYNASRTSLGTVLKSLSYDMQRIEKACELYAEAEKKHG